MSSVEPHIGLNLRMYITAVDMWNSLKNVYSQGINAWKYTLAIETNGYTQGIHAAQEYYWGFMNLWLEYNSIVYEKVPQPALTTVQDIQ